MTWSVIKDVFAIAATVVGITGAIIGFNQWREIEWAKAEFEVSRRLLTSVFKTRDWLKESRRWMILSSDFPDGYESGSATIEQKRDAYLHMFNIRFKPLRDCAVELQSLRPEAEALWGSEVIELTGKLLACCRKLETAMSIYVHMLGKGTLNDGRPEKHIEATVQDIPRNITAENPDGEENEFTQQIRITVDAIEQYVRDKQKSIRRVRH